MEAQISRKLVEYADNQDFLSENYNIGLNVLMATCPQSHPPTAPHPALPYLQGYLRKVFPNVQTTTKDLNAVFYASLFSEEQLKARFSPEEAAKIRKSYESQQDAQAYRDIPRFISHHQTLEDALNEVTRQHQEKYRLKKESLILRGNNFTYVSEHPGNSREGILEGINRERREGNIFYDFYNDEVIPPITEKKYDVVALSVHLPDQLLPTFLLASMIKEKSPKTKVVLGGNYVTRLKKTFTKNDEQNRALFDCIDAIVTYEGEWPLRQVLERIAESKDGTVDFSGINQVIYRKGNQIVANLDRASMPRADMDALPRPDFDGIFTELNGNKSVYWTPTPVISLYTERGCKWANVCDFCSIPWGNNTATGTGARSTTLVAQDMKFYQDRYGSTAFSFGNETLSRQFMSDLTDELDKLSVAANIDGYTRTDQFRQKDGIIDANLIQKVGKYFRFLQLGIESGDEEALKSMRKSRTATSDSELVKALFENGIYSHAFFIVGFPPDKSYVGKTRDDFMNFYLRSTLATLQWLDRNKEHVGTFKATPLYVPRDDGKMVVEDNGSFRIHTNYEHEIALGQARDLEPNVPYQKINGSTKLDRLLVRLFDEFEGPYRNYAHHTIYHQRLFNWREGVQWSQRGEEKLLRQIWNEAVGKEYMSAIQELHKKGGISQDKRERLQAMIQDAKSKNKLLRLFPEGLTSIDQLVELDLSYF